jgi:uncharacterized CHY-type Zn-finger protein
MDNFVDEHLLSGKDLVDNFNDPILLNNQQNILQPKRNTATKPCQFYLNGFCKFGTQCRFEHIANSSLVPIDEPAAKNRIKNSERRKLQPRPPVSKPSTAPTDPSERLQFMRNFEIQQMTKRYTPKVLEIASETVLTFQFSPSDPDFPFDLPALSIKLSIPSAYPSDRVLKCTVVNVEIPTVLKKNIQQFITERIISTQSTLLDMMKQLDRELEGLLIEKDDVHVASTPMKSSMNIQIVKASDIFTHSRVIGKEIDEIPIPLESNEETRRSYYGLQGDSDSDDHQSQEGSVFEEPVEEAADPLTEERNDIVERMEQLNMIGINTGKVTHSGTQIKLHSLAMINVAYLKVPMLNLHLACFRCKSLFDLDLHSSLGYEHQIFHTCPKCSNSMAVNYRGELIHMSNSRLGYLDLVQCNVMDVLASDIFLNCGECGGEAKKHERLSFLNFMCRTCHNRISVTSTVKFLKVTPTVASSTIDHKKAVKKSKDLNGLQGDGTCEHYKKSRRWFRFPCCAKLFPCDICHDKQSDHPAEWATKIVCGLCRTEQTYTSVCKTCKTDVIGSKKSRFWEGGKGTRNRALMSRNDKQKYKGLTKTVSNKNQSK